jgi:hypothetical protein
MAINFGIIKKVNKMIKESGGMDAFKSKLNAAGEVAKLYKGKVDVSIMAQSYLGALKTMREEGMTEYIVKLPDEEYRVDIKQNIKEIHKFFKRGILIDLSNRDMLDKYIARERISTKDQEELLSELNEIQDT